MVSNSDSDSMAVAVGSASDSDDLEVTVQAVLLSGMKLTVQIHRDVSLGHLTSKLKTAYKKKNKGVDTDKLFRHVQYTFGDKKYDNPYKKFMNTEYIKALLKSKNGALSCSVIFRGSRENHYRLREYQDASDR